MSATVLNIQVFDELNDMVSNAVDEIVDRIGFNLQSEIKNRTPEKDGIMKAAWQMERDGKNIIISNNLPYAERREAEGGAPVVGSTRHKFGVGVAGHFVEASIDVINDNLQTIVDGAMQ